MSTRKKTRSDKEREIPAGLTGTTAPVRVVAGLGDPERERRLLDSLTDREDVVIVDRCLSADQVLASVRGNRLDAALVAADLHRLSGERLTELERTGVALVVLAPDPTEERWRSFRGVILPLDADAESVRRGLLAAVRGESLRPTALADEDVDRGVPVQAEEDLTEATVFTVAGGPGSPGRTTVSLNLAVALGAVASTVLVDADLDGPSIAAYLDVDPTRNLAMLAHAEPESSGDWQRTIAQETQPICPRSRHSAVLCGVPKPEMRNRISIHLFERLVAELRQRYHYVILDVGADFLGPDAGIHRAAPGLAQQILLVTSADLIGLWRARTTIALLETQLQVDPERVALVINRHDRRRHHGRAEIEWALGLPAAAMVPYDHANVQRALGEQQPLVLSGGRASRALLDLAERAHGGHIVLPDPGSEQRRGWRERIRRLVTPRHAGTSRQEGARDGERLTQLS